jgi:23S rRNA pseudouridine2457 synthase
MRYLLFFKPFDVLPEFVDPDGAGRPTLAQYVPVLDVQPAGRLDRDSEGLMLLTDDGELAHRLTHPRYHLPKIYFVQVERIPDDRALASLRRGVLVKGEMTAPSEVELLSRAPDLPPRPLGHPARVPTAWLRLVLREGKKRQIRHMTAAVGHPTLRLVRVAIGPLTLRGLAPGEWRELAEKELHSLRDVLGWHDRSSMRNVEQE